MPIPRNQHGRRAGSPFFISAFVLLLAFVASSDATAETALQDSPAPALAAGPASAEQFHKYELSFTDTDRSYSENGSDGSSGTSPNPYRHRRLTCSFTAPDGVTTYLIHGFFDSDGAGGPSGRRFTCRFSPNVPGPWSWTASFREGNDVAIDLSAAAGSDRSASIAEPMSGSFTVVPSTASLPDFRAATRGWLQMVGEHLPKFNGSQKRFLKAGMNTGENFLAYRGFDNTHVNTAGGQWCTTGTTRSYANHVQDWRPGDPDWSCADGCEFGPGNAGAGRAIIGAINYLAGTRLTGDACTGGRCGVNAKYLILNTTRGGSSDGGDSCDVYAGLSHGDIDHFDTSKLDQWEVVFEHFQRMGIALNLQLSDDGTATWWDGSGTLGPQRKLYFREMVARFGHHPAIQWNIAEENTFTDSQRRGQFDYLRALDPYGHAVSSHTQHGQTRSNDAGVDGQYLPLLGYPDVWTSFQVSSFNSGDIRSNLLLWRTRSANAGAKWAVSIDESFIILHQDDGSIANARKTWLWPALTAASHFEWYPKNASDFDLDFELNDYAETAGILRQSGVALGIFDRVELAGMEPDAPNSVCTSTASAPTFSISQPGLAYVAWNESGGNFRLDLSGASGQFDVTFFDPATGASCVSSRSPVTGGAAGTDIGSCNCCSGQDVAVLIRLRGTGQCGDGIVDPSEQCDDGNTNDNDCCSSACLIAADGGSCEDGNACTTADTCSLGSCVGGPPPDCSDGNACTFDSCDASLGCRHVVNTNPCNDADACTIDDHCTGGACLGTPVDCSDANPCTDDACNASGQCTHASNASLCDDGDACTSNDSCSLGVCSGIPLPSCTSACGNGVVEAGEQCDDGNTADGDCCSAACRFEAEGTACDDGFACTTADACSSGICVGTTPAACDDGNPCTLDLCDDTAGCVNAAAPVAGCRSGDKATLKIKDVDGDLRDRLKWSWRSSTPPDFPFEEIEPGLETHTLCVYDRSGGAWTVADTLSLPPSGFWESRGNGNWRYRNSFGTFSGLLDLRLQNRSGGLSKAKVVAGGPNLALTAREASARVFAQEPDVVVQLIDDQGQCISSTFASSDTSRNAAGAFRATQRRR